MVWANLRHRHRHAPSGTPANAGTQIAAFVVRDNFRNRRAIEEAYLGAIGAARSEITIANAYRDAQKLKGEGDAEAARTYADAFGKDPQFAQFYRSLDAYKTSVGKKGDVLVIDPAATEFFSNMRAPQPSRR